MIVTATALQRQPHKCRTYRFDSVSNILRTKFFRHASPFRFLRMEPIEGRRQNLRTAGIRA